MKLSLSILSLVCLSLSFGQAEDRPNILWLTCEDNNVNWVGCYGNPYAETPNIDRLASEGFQYMNCYANAPVCAPSRCTWITGIHAVSMGTHPMRSRYEIPHDRIKYYPDYLKAAGYYVVNAGKTDYNIGGRDDKDPWDSSKPDFEAAKQNQPFFMIINSTKSHESRAFGDIENTAHSPGHVQLAKYHPDIPEMRKNYAHYHDQVKNMDADIGAALAQLEEAGLAENTIVIHNSDHGGVIARSKRFLFNSGTHCPLIIRIPEKFKHLRPGSPGDQIDELVSFIDMPKTWLSITGAEVPEVMQGRVFLGPDKETRDFHVSFRGRMDERCDNVRALRDQTGRWLYIRNYMPYAPWGQRLNYLWIMEATNAWQKYHDEGRTDAITGRFFGTKPMEELYDTSVDPDNVNNLIDDPQYAAQADAMRQQLTEWQTAHYDAGLLPETEMVKLAADYEKTLFDFVRDETLYPVASYLEASEMALKDDPSHAKEFYERLSSEDVGIRYWAVEGLFHIQDRIELDAAAVRAVLNDSSDHVRLMAAWMLYREGDKETAIATINDLLSRSSYASLKAFNVIDWIGDGIEPFQEAALACQAEPTNYVDQMKEYLIDGYEPKKKKKK
ncbi:MAG: sulfatase-like hydrolase/transferase [Verrucomicrobiota bacterium]